MAASFRYTALLLALISATGALLPQEANATDVQFVVAQQVAFGQGFVITGNTSSLGNWTPTSAPLMSLASGSESYWLLTVALDAGLYVEFKPVRVVYDTKEALEWYIGSNLNIT
ncbi:carbohydrate-binding module family 20 domain-containing protein, partial [Salmonella sp. s24813]